MRAMQVAGYGQPPTLAEVPIPSPGPDQVQIRVVTASVNPIDWKLAAGALRFLRPLRFPWIPGFDVAGEVTAVGPGVTSFAVGDRVHARLADQTTGSCAEVTVAGCGVTTKMPAGMSFADAAALPLAGMTALQGLRDDARLPMSGATGRVLVVGASGGVGHLGVQLARAAGATVVGVCSGRNAALVASLGAHEVLDYTRPDPFAGQAPFDVVLDCVGGPPSAWTPMLTPHGRYASTMPGPSVFLRAAANPILGRSVRPVLLKPNAADLEVLDRLHERGELRVVVAARYPLAELAQAWTASRTGRTAGKIVIDVAEAAP